MVLLVSAEPEASPLQVVSTYRIPVAPETVPLATDAVAVVPALYQPAPFDELYWELTVR